MKKGFTLIELLAVIVILAIIALIATPIVLNIINDTKESAQLRSAEMYLNAVEQTIARNNMNGTFNPVSCNINENGNLECDGETEEVIVEVDGEKPIGGSISFEDGKINKVSLSFNNDKLVIKNENGELIYGEKICTLKPGQTALAIGAAYTCDPGDGENRTFYLLEKTSTTVSLLMNENIEGPMTWEEAKISTTNLKSTWRGVNDVTLPTYDQIYNINGGRWYIDNLEHPAKEFYPAIYYTSTSYIDSGQTRIYVVGGDSQVDGEWMGEIGLTSISDDDTYSMQIAGLRPVITIPIDQL